MAERVYGGLSADERSARRHEQLLAAGLEVFAEHGWAGSTVQDVCRAAALSPRYFYELFDSREALFLEVTAGIAAQVQETVRTALASSDRDPVLRARAVLSALAGFFADDPRLVRVALMESLATEQFRDQRRRLLAEFAADGARLMRPLRTGSAAAGRSPRTLQLSATVLTGGMVEALIAHHGAGRPVSRELLVDHLLDLYVAAAHL